LNDDEIGMYADQTLKSEQGWVTGFVESISLCPPGTQHRHH
jgi:hypothetical protein